MRDSGYAELVDGVEYSGGGVAVRYSAGIDVARVLFVGLRVGVLILDLFFDLCLRLVFM